MKNIILLTALIFTFASCKKKAEDVPVADTVIVPEFLDINPTTSSKLIGETAQFSLKYYNNVGVLSPTPTTGITWVSSNPLVATINQQGLATAVGSGQTFIKATYNNITSTSALLTIVANNNSLSTITISPNGAKEILLNGSTNLSSAGTNITGAAITGLTFLWASSNATIVQVNQSGVATGLVYGTANVTASSNGIQSAPTTVQVIRQGTFVGSNSAGMAKLKFENGNLVMQTTSNFSVSSSPPDLRIYLSNNATNINGGVQIAALTTTSQTNGARSWNIPTSVSITQYRYAVVWCAQFPGTYGVADFGL
jgi:Electron transfer DM13/Bacterial Ig-like domain (group 2)